MKVLLLSLLLCTALFSAPKAEVVDQIVARVGNSVILKSEVLKELQTTPIQGAKPANFTQAREALIESLVIEKLVNKLKIATSDEEIQSTIKNIVAENKLGSVDNFKRALSAQGINFSSYKSQLTNHLNKMKLIQMKVKNRVHVSDDMIMRAYEASNPDSKEKKRLVKQINIPINSKEEVAAAKKKAHKIQALVKKDKKIEQAAKSVSNAEVFSLGEIQKGTLVKTFEEPIFTTRPGDITEPIVTDTAVLLFYVESEVAVEKIPLEKIKKSLHNKVLEQEIEKAFRRYMNSEKQQADIKRYQ